MMNLTDVVIKLNAVEVQNLLSIEMDNDGERALAYIHKIIMKKVKRKLESH